MTPGNVLVVDDAAVNRMLLEAILSDAGYHVRVASGGVEAIALIDQSVPDIVLLDIRMPEMDGIEVCARLKSRPRLAAMPVIFISSEGDIEEKVRAFEAGGVDFVMKPFEPAEVLARVGTQVKLFKAQRELELRNVELQRRNEQLARANDRTERMFIALSTVLPGSTIDGTYRIDEKIGEGGFGAVFRGMHLELRRPVAIKVLRPGAAEELGRFRNEAVTACRVTHKNAVEVFDFGVSSDGIAYLVMELLSGRSLGSLLRSSRTLPVSRCAEIGGPVCDVLAAAHAAGIVHRDIKPDNVFLHMADGDEIVKVVDFGIAKLLDVSAADIAEATRLGAVVGTPAYIAPERLLGRPYDERADIYSLGVLLYVMLTGELPFGESSNAIGEMIRLHLSETPHPLRERNAAVPEQLAETVMLALDREPSRRPTVQQVAAALRLGLGA